MTMSESAKRGFEAGRSFRYALPLLFIGLIFVLSGCPAFFNQPPVAIADGSPLAGEAPLAVSFDATASFDADGSIVSYEWDFGGGNTGAGQTPSHTFESQGTFKVILTVTDNQGAKGSDSLFVNVGTASIYFATDRDGPGFDLFRMDTSGGSQAQVTDNASDDLFPSLLPNTRGKLAFSSDRRAGTDFDIFTSEPDGTLPSNLTPTQTASHEIEPSWSPDGTKLAFASDRTGDWEIFIMNADGTDVTQLTSQSGSQEVAPAISPDGTKILFVSITSGGDHEIWSMDIDGTVQTKLVDSANNDGALGPDLGPAGLNVLGANVGFGISTPSWSPDGSRFAFTSDRDGGDLDIFIADADGSNVIQLTSSSSDDYDPFWLPNGEEIAFVSERDGGVPQIFKINVSSKAVTQLTSAGNTDVTPASSDNNR